MNIPNEIIERAIEGGWMQPLLPPKVLADQMSLDDLKAINNAYVLDKTFWQALGKSLEWFIGPCTYSSLEEGNKHCAFCNAHRFYTLILTDGDTKQYWAELLQSL